MLTKVSKLRRVKKEQFLKYVSGTKRQELLSLASSLAGKRVVHVNAVAEGGGVVEVLSSFIPYLSALGLKPSWYVINPRLAGPAFFAVTNRFHNALQGIPVRVSRDKFNHYQNVNKKIAADLRRIPYDILVIHDLQPLFAINNLFDRTPKIYISHIDTSLSHPAMWDRIEPALERYHHLIFSNRQFVNKKLPRNKVSIIPPAIDPLVKKQQIVAQKKARKYLERYGISPRKPLIVQVSRFDVWKNPLGVIEAFRIVERAWPKVQLALVGFRQAKDNPEADIVYRDVARVAAGSANIFLFFEPSRVKDIVEFTMMAQNAADIIVQNSSKEGFGLTVAEAMWKRKAVVGGPAPGVRLQIIHGKTGYIVKSPDELAQRITQLLADPEKRRLMGEAGRQRAEERFLLPRFTLENLKLYSKLFNQ